MYCPQCRAHHPRDRHDPSEVRAVEWVTVLVAHDGVVLALTKSLLEGAGVRYRTRGEPLQNLFGPLVWSVDIQVDPEDAAEARGLLAGLERRWPREA